MRSWALFPTLAAFALGASAQTTTLFVTGVTSPGGGVTLSGTALNPNTGQPVRHLWSADNANGLCRVDPDLDTAGAHAINPATCIRTAVGFRLVPGPLTFDPTTGNLYIVDRQGKSVGIFRFHYVQSGDGGQGLVNPNQQEVLGGVSGGASICGLGNNVPLAAALGPDGNLYVGFQKTGNIMRIVSPGTEPLPCSNIQANIATTVNATGDSGAAFVVHDFFGVDAAAPILVQSADNCFTPQNNFTSCRSSNIASVFNPIGIVSDQTYPSTNGSTVYYYDHLTVTQFRNINNPVTGPILTRNYGGLGFQFISALAVDASNRVSEVLYVADDPTTGVTEGTGRWFQVTEPPPAPAAPGTPTSVAASPGNGQAGVAWTAAQDGQPVTSFTVHNNLASNGVLVPDTTVTAPAGSTIVPATVTIVGLVNGALYEFEVSAANAIGSSPLSAPSNPVTPAAPTVPGPPPAVVASPSDSSAQVAWTAPSNGGNPITSYTVTVLAGGVPSGVTITAPGNATGLPVTGLTNGTTYTFTVHATNAIGNGPESAASNAVTPLVTPTPPDVSLAMTGSASVAFGGTASYTLSIRNSGNTSASQVVVTDNLPPIGATLLSAAPSQGSCQLASTTLTCNLGAMSGGASASITLSVEMLAQGANQASAVAGDAAGNPVGDATPGDNSASVSTAIAGTQTATDIQVVGSAQNGGPTHGGVDTYTWQIKNGGNQVANDVVFTTTLPSTLPFASASSPQAVCTGPAPGSGGVITCSAATLAVGQTIVVTVNVTVPVVGTFPVNGSGTFNGTDTNQGNNTFGVTIQVK